MATWAWAAIAETEDGSQVLVPFRTAVAVALLGPRTVETSGVEVAS